MFEHLDDDRSFVPDVDFRSQVERGARRRRRHRREVVLGLTIAPLLAVGGAAVYLRAQVGELRRVEIDGLAPVTVEPSVPNSTAPTLDTVTSAAVAPMESMSAPMNVLVLGVDTRPPGDPSGVTGTRSDTIAIARIDPIAKRLAIMSIPRDLWISSEGNSQRINALVNDRSKLVRAIADVLGIEINHYVEISFSGFRRLIDLAGGVNVPFGAALRDEHTGFAAGAGCQHLDGDMALAYVRSRHMQQLDAVTGKWFSDPTSDLGRIARQQDLVQRIMASILTGDYSAADELRIVTSVFDNMVVDTGLTVDTLHSLFTTAREIGGTITAYSLAGAVHGEVIAGQSVLVPDERSVAEITALFVDPSATPVLTEPGTPPPAGALAPTAGGC